MTLYFDGFDNMTSDLHQVGPTSMWSSFASIPQAALIGSGQMVQWLSAVASSKTLWNNALQIGGGFYYRHNTAALIALSSVLQFRDSAAATQCYLAYTSGRKLAIVRGSTVLAESSIVVSETVMAHLAFELVISDTVGSFKLWINGVLDINISLQDTQNTLLVGCNSIVLGGPNAQADHFYIQDGPTLGEKLVYLLQPTADTAQKDWTPSTGGVNATLLDDKYVTTDYVQASLAGQKDIYDISNLPANVTGVSAVRVMAGVVKTDTAARVAKVGVKSVVTEAYGTNITLSQTHAVEQKVYELDPNGNIPWTFNSVNALQGVINVVS